MDWFSHYVIDWQLSIKLEVKFCLVSLGDSLKNKDVPKCFHGNQESQFTSKEFIEKLKE